MSGETAAQFAETAHTGADLIAAERRRQVESEGYSTDHDDAHGWRPLWLASMAYTDGYDWPWSPETFKPTNVVRDHIKAGALAKAACEVADRTGTQIMECYPARGQLWRCEQFLDDVLAGISDLRLPLAQNRHLPRPGHPVTTGTGALTDWAEVICRATHPTRWQYAATSSVCEECRTGGSAVEDTLAAWAGGQQTQAEAALDAGRPMDMREQAELARAFERDRWAGEWNSLPTAVDRLLATRSALPERAPTQAETPRDRADRAEIITRKVADEVCAYAHEKDAQECYDEANAVLDTPTVSAWLGLVLDGPFTTQAEQAVEREVCDHRFPDGTFCKLTRVAHEEVPGLAELHRFPLTAALDGPDTEEQR